MGRQPSRRRRFTRFSTISPKDGACRWWSDPTRPGTELDEGKRLSFSGVSIKKAKRKAAYLDDWTRSKAWNDSGLLTGFEGIALSPYDNGSRPVTPYPRLIGLSLSIKEKRKPIIWAGKALRRKELTTIKAKRIRIDPKEDTLAHTWVGFPSGRIQGPEKAIPTRPLASTLL